MMVAPPGAKAKRQALGAVSALDPASTSLENASNILKELESTLVGHPASARSLDASTASASTVPSLESALASASVGHPASARSLDASTASASTVPSSAQAAVARAPEFSEVALPAEESEFSDELVLLRIEPSTALASAQSAGLLATPAAENVLASPQPAPHAPELPVAAHGRAAEFEIAPSQPTPPTQPAQPEGQPSYTALTLSQVEMIARNRSAALAKQMARGARVEVAEQPGDVRQHVAPQEDVPASARNHEAQRDVPAAPTEPERPQCVICRDVMLPDQEVESLACAHTFHTECIYKYAECKGCDVVMACPYRCNCAVEVDDLPNLSGDEGLDNLNDQLDVRTTDAITRALAEAHTLT